ncbi:MAG: hypothetical protein WA004_10715 [Saprospiraceae bacterium]
MKKLLPILILALAWSSALDAQVKRQFRLPREVSEASGLAILPGPSFVWHNDSDNAPNLYITDGKGELLQTLEYPELPGTDWEDLAVDDAGRIYIGNFGNNCHCREDLSIYIISDPVTNHIDSINFSYPDQQHFPPGEQWRNFDMEAMIWYQDSLHLFSKNFSKKGNDYTKHYVLPAQPGQYVAELRDSFQLPRRFVSAAAISPDKERIALLSLRFQLTLGFFPSSKSTIFVFSNFQPGHFFKGEMRKKSVRPYLFALQNEAIDFLDDETLIVGSEKTAIIPAKAKKFRLGRRFF